MGIISPNYSSLKRFEANLSGTVFSISAPEHNHPRIPANTNFGFTENLYNECIYEQFPSADEREVFSYNVDHINWTFWRRRLLVLIDSIADVRFISSVFKFEQFSSLFDRRHLEHAVERLLFAHGGAYASSGLCRLNWRVQGYNGTQWVAFENDGRYSSGGLHNPCRSVIQSFYLTPISDEHLLGVFFTQVERQNAPDMAARFEELRERVMATSHLQLSEESTRQKQVVEKQQLDQMYPQNLPPYEFDLMPYPQESEVIENLVEEKGSDFINSLPVSKANRMIDERMQLEVSKYKTQVEAIMTSHLRFKNNTSD
jgi:hypothetical protein